MPTHHPNKADLAKGPRRNLLKSIWHFWPLAVWGLVVVFTYMAYREGIQFRRMNAAVDVEQENVSPIDDGNLQSLAPGVARGKPVSDGQVVAIMKDDQLEEKWALLFTEVELERQDKLRDIDADILKRQDDQAQFEIEKEMAQSEVRAYEDIAKGYRDRAAERLKTQLDQVKNNPELVAMLKNNQQPDPEAIKYDSKAAEMRAKAQASELALKRVADRLKLLLDTKQLMQKDSELIVGFSAAEPAKRAEMLAKMEQSFAVIATAGQRKQLDILKQKESRLQLRATRAGIVDRIMKEPGEYVKAGEGILKIVGEPRQIIGFLPQDQLHSIKEGQRVWITPTRERGRIEETTINFLAPRMNTVPDSTSPVPNKRLFGQDVICDLPKNMKLLPGQTVIIHLDDPRNVPILTEFFRRIFHNDDLD